MRQYFSALFSQNRIIGGAAVLAATQFLASFTGLLRDSALGYTFSGSQKIVSDAYISSFRVSDLVFQMFVVAGFSVALVPLLAEKKVKDSTSEMTKIVTGSATIAAIFFAVIALVVAAFFHNIAPVITNFEGEALKLYITFGRLALLSNFVFIFGNAFGQYLITVQRYWVYGLTPIFYSLGTIFGTLFLTTEATFGALGPMVGSLGGAVLYTVIRIYSVYKHANSWQWQWWHPGIIEVCTLMLPRTIALGILQVQLLLFDTVASGLSIGSVTINAFARNFQSAAVGIAGIALAQSAFSLLSQSIAQKQTKRFWMYIRRGFYTIMSVTIPGALLMVVVAPLLGKIVGYGSSVIFILSVSLYSISIPFESANHLLLRGFYSAKQTVIPAIFSVCNGLVAIAIAWLLAPNIGVFAIPIGFATGQIIQLIGLSLVLPGVVKHRVKQ